MASNCALVGCFATGMLFPLVAAAGGTGNAFRMHEPVSVFVVLRTSTPFILAQSGGIVFNPAGGPDIGLQARSRAHR